MKRKLLAVMAIAIMAFSLSSCSNKCVREGKLTEVLDRVFDAGTYTSLDADYAQQYFKEINLLLQTRSYFYN